jgi:integrase/recombinase XerC
MPGRSPELHDYQAEMRRRALRETSIDKGMSVLVRVEYAVGHSLIESTTIELRDWLDGLDLGAKTRYAYISHLSSFWRWALTEERATKNPTLRLSRPKLRPGLPRPVPPADLATLLELAPNTEVRAMVVLAAHAGLRCMEIAGLRADEVMQHLEPPVLVITHGKGDKPRVVPISAMTIEALRAHGLPAYGHVFTDQYGKGLTPSKVSHVLRGYMHDVGVHASAHQLRHAFGTEVYRRSGDLRMTQELMGHSSPSTTAGYTAWAQDKASAVVDTLFT